MKVEKRRTPSFKIIITLFISAMLLFSALGLSLLRSALPMRVGTIRICEEAGEGLEGFEESRKQLVEIGEKYHGEYESGIIVKASHVLHDDLAVAESTGFAGLNIFQYRSPEEATDALSRFRALDCVEYAVRNREISLSGLEEGEGVEADASKSYTFTTASGKNYSFNTWGAGYLGIPDYFEYLSNTYTRLPNVYVAVLDTGIDSDHPLLQGRLDTVHAVDYVKETADPKTFKGSYQAWDDFHGHGTHVAGTIAELTPSNVKIIPCKVLSASGSGSFESVVSAMEYVYLLQTRSAYGDTYGKVVAMNLSLGFVSSNITPETRTENMFATITEDRELFPVKKYLNSNIITLAAAGNDSIDMSVNLPAAVEDTLSVGAIASTGKVSYFSNSGATLDVALPGENIVSAVPVELAASGYMVMSGTSQATPHAAALCALYAIESLVRTNQYGASMIILNMRQNAWDGGKIGKDAAFGYGMPTMRYARLDMKPTQFRAPSLSYGAIGEEISFTEGFTLTITNNSVNATLNQLEGWLVYTTGQPFSLLKELAGEANSYVNAVPLTNNTAKIPVSESTNLRFHFMFKDANGVVKAFSPDWEVSYYENGDRVHELTPAETKSGSYTLGLKHVAVPQSAKAYYSVDGKTYIGILQDFFNGCDIRTVTYTADDLTLLINSRAFLHCTSLERLIGKNGADLKIGVVQEYGFYDCRELKSVDLSEAKIIYTNAFSSCEKLETLNLSSWVSSSNSPVSHAERDIFSGTLSLKRVILGGNGTPVTESITKANDALNWFFRYSTLEEVDVFASNTSVANIVKQTLKTSIAVAYGKDTFYSPAHTAYMRSGGFAVSFTGEGIEDVTENYAYGVVPCYPGGEDPGREDTAAYSYTFLGWSDGKTVYAPGSALPAVTGKATYTAVYKEELRYYQIVFLADDMITVISTQSEAYGTVPVCKGTIPTKEGTIDTSYPFAGWISDDSGIRYPVAGGLPAVSGDESYYAYYGEETRKYNVTFNFDNGNPPQTVVLAVEYGTRPEYTGATPKKPSSTQYSYTFKGWKDKNGNLVTEFPVVLGDVTYTAEYTQSERDYCVYFKDYNGTTKLVSYVRYGYRASYIGSSLRRESDAQYNYTFAGWKDEDGVEYSISDDLPAITKDTVFTAFYTTTLRSYTVFFKFDGELLQRKDYSYGTVPVFEKAEPEKASTTEHCYTFAGWEYGNVQYSKNEELPAVTGETVYKAYFNESLRPYAITFKNENAVIIIQQVEYSTRPVFAGATPMKPSTVQYEYKFAGWTDGIKHYTADELPTVRGAATYTAEFTEHVRSYTVTFKNGSNVVQTSNVFYGERPVYKGTNPKKMSTVQYTFAFKGWTDGYEDYTGELPVVYGSAVYTAVYYEYLRSYTITFSNGADLLESKSVPYGTRPVYTGATPEKESSAQYHFTFAGWTDTVEQYESDELPLVSGESSYYAYYSKELRSYTVAFYNGTTKLESKSVPYGTVPAFTGQEPQKTGTAEKIYVFAGWSSGSEQYEEALPAVTGAADYFACFNEQPRPYTVTFMNGTTTLEEKPVPYGTAPVYTGATPVKQSTVQYEYVFSGWTDGVKHYPAALPAVTGEATYTAEFTEQPHPYTVTFKNGTTTLEKKSVLYGMRPAYERATPQKTSTVQYDYIFTGWTDGSKEYTGALPAVTGEATYTAVYREQLRSYAVTFKNGTEQLNRISVSYGTAPVYTAEAPAKESTAQYDYVFMGWTDGSHEYRGALPAVTGAITYTAFYSEQLRSYTVTFMNDTTLLESKIVQYGVAPAYLGATPVKESTAQYNFTFAGWSDGSNGYAGVLPAVTGDVTYTAHYHKQLRSYTVAFYNDSTRLESKTVTYGTVPAYLGATPQKASTVQYDYIFAGWSDGSEEYEELPAVTGEVSYTAFFRAELRSYCVTYLEEGGSEFVKSSAKYGTAPAFPETVPVKEGTEDIDYIFRGWKGEDGTVYEEALPVIYGDVSFTAVYTEKVWHFSVTFYDDSLTVYTILHASYGEVPSVDVSELMKPSTAQYDYVFAGWENEEGTRLGTTLPAVTKDTSFTAYFTEQLRSYTVLFRNENGTTLQSTAFVYGTVPAYTGASPEKESSVQYRYRFAGWKNEEGTVTEFAPVTGEVTYTAFYNAQLRSYAVTFKNENGTVLYTAEFDYGTTPVYAGVTPAKESTPEFDYTFTGWSNGQALLGELPLVQGETVYTAEYAAERRSYEVTFTNGEAELEKKSVSYGAVPAYAGATPEKESTAQYNFTFKGWSDAEGRVYGIEEALPAVTGNVVYAAAYQEEERFYSVTFKMDDKELCSLTVKYGALPSYTGELPAKENTPQFNYTFAGWTDGEEVYDRIYPVIGETVYIAYFTAEERYYTVTFQNVDGSHLSTLQMAYGLVPFCEEPEPSSTAEYSYYFAGWETDGGERYEKGTTLPAVTGTESYTAYYTAEKRTYTITFLGENGTVLGTDSPEYGESPVYTDTLPIKQATTQYEYVFSGWTNGENTYCDELPAVTGDVSYTAVFTSEVRSYRVTFKNGDKELSTVTLRYGEKPLYTGDKPEKESSVEYHYSFAGWTDGEESYSDVFPAVTGEVTYTAVFNSYIRSYYVSFFNAGIMLYRELLVYGTALRYEGMEPEKRSSAQYFYRFAGWCDEDGTEYAADEALPAVSGEITYTAYFTEETRKYTIIFKNANGEELSTAELDYGKIPAYTGEIPQKKADVQHVYTFIGWSNGNSTYVGALPAVSASVIYVADYSAALREYTIVFKNEDGSLLAAPEITYGEVPVYPGETPAKAGTEQCTYVFAGWKSEDIEYKNGTSLPVVTGNAVYSAFFIESVRKYTVTFQNEGGKILGTPSVSYGDIPMAVGEQPVKTSTAQYRYVFAGWKDVEGNEYPTGTLLPAVTGSVTYTAYFTPVLCYYTVTFKNEDGTTLYSEEVAYGDSPEYGGMELTKASTGKLSYTFAGWQSGSDTYRGKLPAVTRKVTYTAFFDSAVRQYEVTFLNEDGSELLKAQVSYEREPKYPGKTPVKESTAEFNYTFYGWVSGENEYTDSLPVVVENATYRAKFTATVRQYTVSFMDGNGNVAAAVQLDYGSLISEHIPENLTPAKEGEGIYVYLFTGWNGIDERVDGDRTVTSEFSRYNRFEKEENDFFVDVSATRETSVRVVLEEGCDSLRVSFKGIAYTFSAEALSDYEGGELEVRYTYEGSTYTYYASVNGVAINEGTVRAEIEVTDIDKKIVTLMSNGSPLEYETEGDKVYFNANIGEPVNVNVSNPVRETTDAKTVIIAIVIFVAVFAVATGIGVVVVILIRKKRRFHY